MNWSRRNVLKAGIAVAGVTFLSKLPLAAAATAVPCVRIVPIPGQCYPPSFLNFADRARFKTPRDAIASVRDRRLSYDLVWQ